MRYVRFDQRPLPFVWPTPSFQVALIEPEIPPNTGNIARLCAATNTPLHLVGKLGFRVSDAELKRAGLDYWDSVRLTLHEDFETFEQSLAPARFFFFSARAERSYTSVGYEPGDVLVFGSETRGLPEQILERRREHVLGIPVLTDHVRSLNLSTSVGIVLYEALRQVANQSNGESRGGGMADAQDLKSCPP